MDSKGEGEGGGEGGRNENGRISSPHSVLINLNKGYAINLLFLGARNFGTVISTACYPVMKWSHVDSRSVGCSQPLLVT